MSTGKAHPNKDPNESLSMLPQKTLFALWLFGDKRLMPALCNYAMNLIFAAISPSQGLRLDEDVPRMVYEQTLKGAKLRSLIVEAAAVEKIGLGENLEINGDDALYTAEFLVDLTERLKALASAGMFPSDKLSYWRGLDLCSYHKHGAESNLFISLFREQHERDMRADAAVKKDESLEKKP